MKFLSRRTHSTMPLAALIAAAALLSACGGGGYGSSPSSPPVTSPPPPAPYTMSKLVSDGSVTAVKTDPQLINPWGLVLSPTSPFWVANAGSQTSTLYEGTGNVLPLIVTIPPGLNGPTNPTGIVFNGSPDFSVTANGVTGVPAFIFAGEGGTIVGWSPTVAGTQGTVGYDDGPGHAIYKGLAIAGDNTGNFLYATDFHNGKVDVFDKHYAKVQTTGGFTDPTLPAGYAPFGIRALQLQNNATLIYVTYAKQDADAEDDVAGAGLGLVNVFNLAGVLQKHLIASGGVLNAPWGLAIAPPTGFGDFGNKLLVGNFGDGTIHAFDVDTGELAGSVNDSNGQPITTAGLWGIAFGNGAHNQPTSTLFFTAGIGGESGGLFGRIDAGATAPDIVAPTSTLTAPAAGNVSGTVTLTATAGDNVGVTQVRFLAGATTIATVTTPPYTTNWDTTPILNGSNVNLTAEAKDAAGNVTLSAVVVVTVNNPVVAPPAAAKLSDLQAAIFTPRCSTCHTGNGNTLPGSMNLSSTAATFASLVGVTSLETPTLKRVTAGDAANSWIIHKLEGTNLNGTNRMPLGGPFLDQATIDQVKSWIAAGAQNN